VIGRLQVRDALHRRHPPLPVEWGAGRSRANPCDCPKCTSCSVNWQSETIRACIVRGMTSTVRDGRRVLCQNIATHYASPERCATYTTPSVLLHIRLRGVPQRAHTQLLCTADRYNIRHASRAVCHNRAADIRHAA